MGQFGKYWEMQKSGGPYDEERHEVFKCTECGGETQHPEGWNGEPDRGNCRHGCSSRESDYKAAGGCRKKYRANYALAFGHE